VTVSLTVAALLPIDAVMVTLVVVLTAWVVTVKVPVLVPAFTPTALGTDATDGLLETNFTATLYLPGATVRVNLPVLH